MRTRTKIAVGVIAVVAMAFAGVAWYLDRTAGQAEVREITERVAVAISAGDRSLLAAEPMFQAHPETVEWLLKKGPGLAGGYRVSSQRNGDNGYQLFDLDLVTHVGVITTPSGKITLGFRRNPDGNGLKFVTAAGSSMSSVGSEGTGGEIEVGDR